jgi:hypothetical protein
VENVRIHTALLGFLFRRPFGTLVWPLLFRLLSRVVRLANQSELLGQHILATHTIIGSLLGFVDFLGCSKTLARPRREREYGSALYLSDASERELRRGAITCLRLISDAADVSREARGSAGVAWALVSQRG